MPAILQQPFPTGRLEFTQYISPDGTVYKFDNQYDQFKLAGASGMGMPPITYRTQRGPFQDGVTPLGFQLEPRIIQLLHRRNGGNRQEYWDNRSDIINILRPNRQLTTTFQTGILRKILPDQTVRDLSVFIFNSLSFEGTVPGIWDEFSYTEAIQFIAHDPTWFDPIEVTFDSVVEGGTSLVFPFEFPFDFKDTLEAANNTITYPGTWLTNPTIVITGPIKSAIIRNLTTNEKIELDYFIPDGDTVTIVLLYGNKTVVDNNNVNRIGSLTTDSDLGTFHIAPDPEATDGINSFFIGGDATGVNTKIEIKYFTRYIGI